MLAVLYLALVLNLGLVESFLQSAAVPRRQLSSAPLSSKESSSAEAPQGRPFVDRLDVGHYTDLGIDANVDGLPEGLDEGHYIIKAFECPESFGENDVFDARARPEVRACEERSNKLRERVLRDFDAQQRHLY